MVEATLLLSTLDSQRRHILGAVEGLSEEDLRRPVLPTGWNCLGLMQHLAVDVEHFWFWRVVAGRPENEDDIDDAWQVPPEVTAHDVIERYRRATERASAVIEQTPLEAAPAWWPEELFGTWRLEDLREIVLHVITETATHAGHLDAARELLDGKTWMVLT